jgi:hypothetical protein
MTDRHGPGFAGAASGGSRRAFLRRCALGVYAVSTREEA